MKNYLLLFLAVPLLGNAQFKNDNVLYKTVYWPEFCKQFKPGPDALLLDVRSKGEYDDTSRNAGLNIGHLKGATHINVTELDKRLHELDAYKDKPVYIYCSHSQRSRRSSKMLTDSGFTNVININGGLTDLYLIPGNQVPCKEQLLVSANGYTQLNPAQVHAFVHSNPGISIIDVRKDSAFRGISNNAKDKALGRLKGSINFPLSTIDAQLNKIPKNKPVLLVDASGDEAAKAAALLVLNGYKNVYTSFNGLEAWLMLDAVQKSAVEGLLEQNISYQILDAEAFSTMAAKTATIIDIRPAEEFENKSQTAWRNRGHIKGAINISLDQLQEKMNTIPTNQPVILYGLSNNPEIYKAAEILTSGGLKNIFVLSPGIWGLRYQAFNTPNSMYLNDWVVDVPEENR